jgi:hypothetical protein
MVPVLMLGQRAFGGRGLVDAWGNADVKRSDAPVGYLPGRRSTSVRYQLCLTNPPAEWCGLAGKVVLALCLAAVREPPTVHGPGEGLPPILCRNALLPKAAHGWSFPSCEETDLTDAHPMDFGSR